MDKIEAIFQNGTDTITINGLTQHDKDVLLHISGEEIPEIFELHMDYEGRKTAIRFPLVKVEGVATVTIPYELTKQKSTIRAWVYVITSEGCRTKKQINLPIIPRTKPDDVEGTVDDSQKDCIEQLIEESNDLIESAEQLVKKDFAKKTDIPTKTSQLTNDSDFVTKEYVDGSYTIAGKEPRSTLGDKATAEGKDVRASGIASHAEGSSTEASGDNSHSEGEDTRAKGGNSHAEGLYNTAFGRESHAEGTSKYPYSPENKDNNQIITDHNTSPFSLAKGWASHNEGENTVAIGTASHAEGSKTIAVGNYSHTEGLKTSTLNPCGHAEGYGTKAHGDSAHAEGHETVATGGGAHAEGVKTQAIGGHSHAEGDNSIAKGGASHAEGVGTIANGYASHSQGKWNVEDTENKYAHIVGGGTNNENRKNIHTVDWNGNAYFAGGIILKSPNGTRFMITVSDEGVLQVSATDI